MRLCSLVFCLVPVGLAASSGAGAGTIAGTVRNLAGSAISGATVEARNPAMKAVFSAVSAATGDYALPALPPGNYAVTVKLQGMKTYAHAYLAVAKEAVIREDVIMEVDDNPASLFPDDPPPVSARVRPRSKNFYAEDGQLELTRPALNLHGKTVELPVTVKGNVVWFYLPGQGRYLLSVTPHAELGFSLAGQVGGNSLWFGLNNQEIQIDADERMVDGSATYNLYVMHESDWVPENEGDRSGPLMGPEFVVAASSN
jgi:hypothetical protein